MSGEWSLTPDPVIKLTWSPGDDSPPCVELECPCGEVTHLCVPQWWGIYTGGEVPTVACAECGLRWFLGQIKPVAVAQDHPSER